MRAAHVAAAGLFLVAASVQLNDPDPVGWFAIYALAAVASVLAALGKSRLPLSAGVAAAAVVWAALLVPAVAAHPPTLEGLTTWHMIDTRAEESRELIGLLIVAGWMIPLAIADWRRWRWPGASHTR